MMAQIKFGINYKGMASYSQQTWRMERTPGSDANAIYVLGHTGGLAYFGYILLLFLLRPISEYSFHLKAARQLFFARTSYDGLFKYSFKTEDEKN